MKFLGKNTLKNGEMSVPKGLSKPIVRRRDLAVIVRVEAFCQKLQEGTIVLHAYAKKLQAFDLAVFTFVLTKQNAWAGGPGMLRPCSSR